MIRSFADKRTADLFDGLRDGSFPASVLKRAQSKLDRISHAVSIDDLRALPGNRLERLIGDRDGQYGIRISRGWRIRFVRRDGDAFEVELNNYYDR